MKRFIKIAGLLVILAALLCVSALAADPTGPGIHSLNSEKNTAVTVTLTPQDADKNVVEKQESVGDYGDFYYGAVRVQIDCSGVTDGSECLLIVTNKETAAPQEADIVYIDQDTVAGTSVSFNAYPSELSKGTYYIYVSTSGGTLTKVGSFEYYQTYKLGDVDEDGKVTANDALCALMMSVDKLPTGKTEWTDSQRLAANVDGTAGVSANDALWILEASVDKRSFE